MRIYLTVLLSLDLARMLLLFVKDVEENRGCGAILAAIVSIIVPIIGIIFIWRI